MKKHLILFSAIFSMSYNHSVSGKTEPLNSSQPVQKNMTVLRGPSIGLNDLETSCKIGFAHLFGVFKYRNTSTVPNHNTPHNVVNKCQNMSFLSFDQNRRLISKFGYETVLDSTIHEMLDNPRARLFQFEDHWGETEDYHFSRSNRTGMCFKLIKLEARVESVFTFGKCVRLFEKTNCHGWSLAVYPGSSSYYRLKLPRHVTLKAIGPCLQNEFAGGYLNKSMPGFVVKNPEMRSFQPDLASMFSLDIHLGHPKVFGPLRVQYLLGPGNRTEIIEARPQKGLFFSIHPKVNVEDRVFQKSLGKEDGDVLGHAIPTTIGGPANEDFNIFSSNRFSLERWEDFLIQFVNRKGIHGFDIQFEYEDRNKTRPLFFYYWIHFPRGAEYGRIINGHRTSVRRDKPYIQVMPKFQYKGTAKINLSQVLERHRRIPKLMDFFFSNSSQKNRRTDFPVINWQSCKGTNFPSDHDLTENGTQSSLLKALIRGMTKNPMVRLFSGENMTGDSEDYHSGQNRRSERKGCHRVRNLANVKTAVTFGTCIRLFEKKDCEGLSLALYGRSGNRSIDTHLKSVKSTGPCLRHEFINSTFTNQLNVEIVKDHNSRFYFPDLVQFGGFDITEAFFFRKQNENLYITYGLGANNRTEYIHTYVDQIGPFKFRISVNVEETDFYKSLDKKEGDVPGFAVPLELNGPPNESFNIFPISRFKVDDWLKLFPSSFTDANEEIFFKMELHFVYENDETTRPQFIYYRFRSSKFIDYGRFLNL